MRRMDRYNNNVENHTNSRLDKNKNLYQDFSMNAVYTNITDVTNANAYEIKPENSYNTREAYQQLKEYQNVEIPKEKKELDDVNYLYKRQDNKIYDINSVLENARKNREEKDSLDTKRSIKNAYNILSGKNMKELEKYREERKKRLTTPEEDELRELIDTIASKTLAGELDKETTVDLLSDLMATNILDKVDASGEIEKVTKTEEITKVNDEVIDEKMSVSKKVLGTAEIEDLMLNGKEQTQYVDAEVIKEEQKNISQKDPDFYTKSMDLSDKDFEMSDDFKDDKVPLGLKILIFILVIIIVGIAAYIIHQRFM
ncbi:MAG: hypothetical protein IJ097_03015 [Bacilli bacterium]|nr:hypothetical protein [Bacilli bacterium]